MLKILLTSIGVALCVSDAHASADATTTTSSSSIEDTPYNLVRTHLSFFDAKLDQIPEINDAEYGIKVIKATLTQIGAIGHQHVKTGCGFGYSFNNKNEAPINAVVKLMTGQSNWKKETIEGISDFSIADIGCGMGLSAVTLVSRIAEFYKANNWNLRSPIKLDLFDISPEHQGPLTAFAKLVNMAYPQYFRVRTYVHDAVAPFPEQNTYRIVLALNLMHYVPQDHWGMVLKNMEGSMQQYGMLFLTTDHYLSILDIAPAIPLMKQAAQSSNTPFCQTTVLLFDPQLGQDKGMNLFNVNFIDVIKRDEPNKSKAIPGGRYQYDEIDLESLSQIAELHMQLCSRKAIPLYLNGKDGIQAVKLEKIIKLLKSGQIALQLSNYGFDDGLLTKAIAESHPSSKLKKLQLGWVNSLLNTDLGLPSTVGITLMKQ